MNITKKQIEKYRSYVQEVGGFLEDFRTVYKPQFFLSKEERELKINIQDFLVLCKIQIENLNEGERIDPIRTQQIDTLYNLIKKKRENTYDSNSSSDGTDQALNFLNNFCVQYGQIFHKFGTLEETPQNEFVKNEILKQAGDIWEILLQCARIRDQKLILQKDYMRLISLYCTQIKDNKRQEQILKLYELIFLGEKKKVFSLAEKIPKTLSAFQENKIDIFNAVEHIIKSFEKIEDLLEFYTTGRFIKKKRKATRYSAEKIRRDIEEQKRREERQKKIIELFKLLPFIKKILTLEYNFFNRAKGLKEEEIMQDNLRKEFYSNFEEFKNTFDNFEKAKEELGEKFSGIDIRELIEEELVNQGNSGQFKEGIIKLYSISLNNPKLKEDIFRELNDIASNLNGIRKTEAQKVEKLFESMNKIEDVINLFTKKDPYPLNFSAEAFEKRKRQDEQRTREEKEREKRNEERNRNQDRRTREGDNSRGNRKEENENNSESYSELYRKVRNDEDTKKIIAAQTPLATFTLTGDEGKIIIEQRMIRITNKYQSQGGETVTFDSKRISKDEDEMSFELIELIVRKLNGARAEARGRTVSRNNRFNSSQYDFSKFPEV
jgi:hypothetical protein